MGWMGRDLLIKACLNFWVFFLKFVANAVQSTFSMMHTRKSHYLPALKLNTKEGTKMDVFEIECKKGYKKGCTFLICTSKMQSSPRSIFFFFAIVFSSFNNQDYYNWKLSISINIKLFLKLFWSKYRITQMRVALKFMNKSIWIRYQFREIQSRNSSKSFK